MNFNVLRLRELKSRLDFENSHHFRAAFKLVIMHERYPMNYLKIWYLRTSDDKLSKRTLLTLTSWLIYPYFWFLVNIKAIWVFTCASYQECKYESSVLLFLKHYQPYGRQMFETICRIAFSNTEEKKQSGICAKTTRTVRWLWHKRDLQEEKWHHLGN